MFMTSVQNMFQEFNYCIIILEKRHTSPKTIFENIDKKYWNKA